MPSDLDNLKKLEELRKQVKEKRKRELIEKEKIKLKEELEQGTIKGVTKKLAKKAIKSLWR